jgi:hypothetical protein
VTIEISGADQELAESFKVTGALAVISPGKGAIDEVSAPPTLKWEDDSSEDSYDVDVYDALGALVWHTSGDFDPGGNKPVEVDYAGPPLAPGMIYQFRSTSLKDGVPISRTEDLEGVFVYRP